MLNGRLRDTLVLTDPRTLEALGTQGETENLEYKRELPGTTSKTKRNALETVVAFPANGGGGTLLFGVDGDANVGDICGLAGTASKELRRINGLIRGLVAPDPHVRVTPSTVDGHFVIRVDVPSGGGTIHGLLLEKDKPEYFIRRNGSTYPAQPGDLAALTGMRATGQSVHLPGRIGASGRAG
ncbi:MAG: AlbA family DNA-binding domain-containing protein [Acidimicrobiales bacterium]